jgi:hypothetical protein
MALSLSTKHCFPPLLPNHFSQVVVPHSPHRPAKSPSPFSSARRLSLRPETIPFILSTKSETTACEVYIHSSQSTMTKYDLQTLLAVKPNAHIGLDRFSDQAFTSKSRFSIPHFYEPLLIRTCKTTWSAPTSCLNSLSTGRGTCQVIRVVHQWRLWP